MSRYTHIPIWQTAQSAGALTLAEYDQRQRSHLNRMIQLGRYACIVDTGETLDAYVSDNRWVTECTGCGSGILVDESRREWICWDCGSQYTIRWPSKKTLAAVEGVLRERVPRLRNYYPTEALAEKHRRLQPDTPDILEWENETFGIDHHSWTSPRTWTTSELVTAAIMNTHIRDNLNETTPALVTTAGDIVKADGSNSLIRVAKGADNEYLRTITGTVQWST